MYGTKDEVKRQTVILLFTTVSTLVTVYIIYSWNENTWRTIKMRAALFIKRAAAKQVDWWQMIADEAATQYNREKA